MCNYRCIPLLESLEPRRLLSSFYLSPGGSDANSGTDPAHPWQTIAKLNASSFQAGDSILFQAGQSFGGNVTFGANDAGTPAAPIAVNTYSYDPSSGIVTVGAGSATINAGNGNGVFASDTAGLSIANLDLVGSGQAANSFNGIQFDDNLAGNVQLPYVHIDDVMVSGFGRYGITIGGSNGKSGFSDVRITNSNVYDNIVGGIETHGVFSSSATTYANSGVYVGHCAVHDNPGYAGSSTHVGDGIVLSDVNGGAIERCESYNNGTQNTHNGGPVGIWAWDSNAVTIQYNESHDNHTNSTSDGGGFDLDGGDTNCLVQYNYSHNNDGPGYGLFQFSGARRWNNNTVRFNISENDARKNNYGAIDLWNGGSGIGGAQIYNNTLYVSPSSGTARGVFVQNPVGSVGIRNNIIQTVGGVLLADVEGKQSGLVFQGNDYWSSGSAFRIKQFTKSYSSLAAWRSATGQETLSGQAVGYSVDPLLNSPGNGGTIGDADNLDALWAYRLQTTSPLIDKGLNLSSLFGINPGPQDFFGDPVPDSQGGLNIGAD